MERIDRQSFDAATFPVIIEIPTRYGDLDTQGHVNNAAVVAILQEARTRFNSAADVAALLSAGLRLLVAGLTVEYAAELQYPAPVVVHCGIIAIGRTSITVAQLARQNGVSAVYAQAVVVIAGASGPAPLPDALRTAYARLLLAAR